jgi:hypothetical protein
MADVPGIDRYMRQAEKFAKANDRKLRLSIGILVGLLLWIGIADTLITVPALAMIPKGERIPHKGLERVTLQSRAEERLMHRVLRLMASECSPHETMFAADVSVAGVPYLKQVAHLCTMDITLVNPNVVAFGDSEVTCADEHLATTSTNRRKYPVTVETDLEHRTYNDIAEVCAVWHAVSILREQ